MKTSILGANRKSVVIFENGENDSSTPAGFPLTGEQGAKFSPIFVDYAITSPTD